MYSVIYWCIPMYSIELMYSDVFQLNWCIPPTVFSTSELYTVSYIQWSLCIHINVACTLYHEMCTVYNVWCMIELWGVDVFIVKPGSPDTPHNCYLTPAPPATDGSIPTPSPTLRESVKILFFSESVHKPSVNHIGPKTLFIGQWTHTLA